MAYNMNYDGIEMDIQLCKSGEIILHHDIYIKDDNGDRFISDMTLDEIKEIYDMATLEDLYNILPIITNKKILLDIKGNDLEIVNKLISFYATREYKNVLFCSFNRKIIHLFPKYFKIAFILDSTYLNNEYEIITKNLSAVILHWTCLDRDFNIYCHNNNIDIYTYTVNTPTELLYIKNYDVDYAITDISNLILENV